MMKYEKAILEHLLDKYERSKSFTGDNRIVQSFSVKLAKLFPKYVIGDSKVKLCRDTKRSFYTGEIDAFCKSEVKTFNDKAKTRIIPYEKAVSMGLRV